MLKSLLTLLILVMFMSDPLAAQKNDGVPENESTIFVRKTEDFTITGSGDAENWQETGWVHLTQRTNQKNASGLETRAKVLYSDLGIYFLFWNQDSLLSATFDADFNELWREDVAEVFLWTDESGPDYFEYEISPLNYELPLLVSNIDGELLHWIPFDNSYKNDRKIIHKTAVKGGPKKSGAKIEAWSAEFFIPFKLLHPLKNIFPESGTKWRANIYRIDYDQGETLFSWQPIEVNFHDYKLFGTFLFE